MNLFDKPATASHFFGLSCVNCHYTLYYVYPINLRYPSPLIDLTLTEACIASLQISNS